MSILFCVPMYGGRMEQECVEGFVGLAEALTLAGLDHDFLFTSNESLITRGRDVLAARFLHDTSFTHMMFVDADIRFTADDVASLWNLALGTGSGVTVACYPMKRDDAPCSGWVDGNLVDLDEMDGPTALDYAGTGFMLIDRKVFEALKTVVPEYRDEKLPKVWEFFADPVENGVKLSEDYFFCKRAREAGFTILCDPSIRLGHVGRKVYE